MLAALLVLPLAQIPTGAYGMPELCAKLRSATGIVHTVDADLRDYPVFVSTKTGDPERVRTLVAAALRGEWKHDAERYRLVQSKVDPDSGFAEFERQYRNAASGLVGQLGVPIKALYRMVPGQMVRFGYPSNPLYRPFTPELQKQLEGKTEGQWFVVARRMAEGIFEFKINLPNQQTAVFSEGGSIELKGLPQDVETALKDDLSKQALTSEDQEAIRKLMSNPAELKIDWKDLDKRDPGAVVADPMLKSIAKVVDCDMAIALPDLSVFVLAPSETKSTNVRGLLEPLSNVVDLAMVNGALIGKTPLCDRLSSAQVRRDVLGKYLAGVGERGAGNADVLSEYVRNQRSASSDCWADAMMLVMSGSVVDESYIGDYPYNLRLYTQLERGDWTLLRSGKPFFAAELSRSAQRSLLDLLLQPRSRLETGKPDPGLWRSLDGDNLSVSAEIVDEKVLIGWTGFVAEVQTVAGSAGMYDMRRRALSHEPLYQPAVRRKLKLTIASVADQQSVESGFTEMIPDAKVKPATWNHLPEEIAKEFRAELEATHKQQSPQGGPPPPAVAWPSRPSTPAPTADLRLR